MSDFITTEDTEITGETTEKSFFSEIYGRVYDKVGIVVRS